MTYTFQPWNKTDTNRLFKLRVRARTYDIALGIARKYMNDPVYTGQN